MSTKNRPARWPYGMGLDKRQARRLRRRLGRRDPFGPCPYDCQGKLR